MMGFFLLIDHNIWQNHKIMRVVLRCRPEKLSVCRQSVLLTPIFLDRHLVINDQDEAILKMEPRHVQSLHQVLPENDKLTKRGGPIITSDYFIFIEPSSTEITNMTGKVIAVCISENKGERKKPVASVQLLPNHGIVGDAHAGEWHRQVSLLAMESIEKMQRLGLDVTAGDFAENITTSGLDLPSLPIGTLLRLGESLVEVTQIGKECHTRCAIYDQAGDCVMPKEGIFVKVLREGVVKAGDSVMVTSTDSL